MHNWETESLLADMYQYAKSYSILLGEKTGNGVLDACIDRLNRLETTVTRPFFLEVLQLYAENQLDESQVITIFLTTENYLFRRTICDLPTNALNKIFLLLHREIVRYNGATENYVEKFKYALLSKKDRGRFPDDAEFSRLFSERQVYLMNSKNKIYIFERIENSGTAEDKDIYRHCDQGDYSIEHIMPQHLNPIWQQQLGDDYENIHETWLHRIANLTLTAYNSKYSNESFQQKKNMKNGFSSSGIRMNTYIAQKDKWTLDELEERDQILSELALEIWPYAVTDYQPDKKELDSYSLDDDANLMGRSIARFTFKNMEQPVSSWTEMFQKVLQILFDEDKSIITKLAVSQDDGLAIHFSSNPGDLSNYLEVGDGIYVRTNTSTQNKVSVLSQLFDLYDESPMNLIFYLRADDNSGDEPGSRAELRRRYWTYALPFIKEKNAENGAFSKVNPSKENWISGFFGINGCNISCVANRDGVRVEFYIGKASVSENKRLFDALYLHKDEFDRKLNVQMTWDRGEEKKTSRIFHSIENVSITNESDWNQMAQFHALWSKNFIDVIVPIMREID